MVKPTKKRSSVAIEIWKAGYGFKEFARVHGCSTQFVVMVVNGRQRSAKLEKLIADTLGRPVESLFPPTKHRKARVAA